MKFRDLAPGPAPQLPVDSFARRRARLAALVGPGHAVVVATHTPKQFSNDVDHVFRPHSDFWYLTGFNEPGAVLVLEGGSGASTLFLRDRKPEAEIWTGRRLGVERAPATLDIDHAFPIGELGARLPGLLRGRKVHAVCDHDPAVKRRVRAAAGSRWVADPKPPRPGGPPKPAPARRRAGVRHARGLRHGMRLIKEPEEVRMLQKACDLGVAAHKEAARAVRAGGHEFQVEAAFGHRVRWEGSQGVGYPSICGCGPNAAVLHYISNLEAMRAGELLLVDAGCEWGYYTSDITRTYPVGGSFSRAQLAIYEVVAAAHKAGMRKVAPGNSFRAPHEAAVGVLVAGLLDLGILEGRHEDAVASQAYRRHFMHGTSHFLGLDVHDAGSYVDDDGKPRRLEEGMCLTVEPGLYFNPDFAPGLPKAYDGIGVRIEDDLLVTAGGRRLLSRGLPTDPEGVADLLAKS